MNNSNKKSGKTFKKTWKGGEGQSVEVVNGNFAHIEPVQATPLEVKIFNPGDRNSFDRAFRAFRALVQKEKILSLFKEKQSFEKRSDRKRRKRNEMKRKRLEADSKEFKEKKPKENKEVKEDKSE